MNNITRRAITIGISNYHELFELKFCKNDGKDVSELMTSLGYIVNDNHNLIGEVTYEQMRESIIEFFTDPNTKAGDTLLFYYSGHGIPDEYGDIYLASSEIDPYSPYRKGFSFTELTKMIQKSNSLRIVTVLDCYYSGFAKSSKGHEDDVATIGQSIINDKTNVLSQGEGKCFLAASQSIQEAYMH